MELLLLTETDFVRFGTAEELVETQQVARGTESGALATWDGGSTGGTAQSGVLVTWNGGSIERPAQSGVLVTWGGGSTGGTTQSGVLDTWEASTGDRNRTGDNWRECLSSSSFILGTSIPLTVNPCDSIMSTGGGS